MNFNHLKSFFATIVLVSFFFSCNIEPYEGDVPEEVPSCEEATQNLAAAALNYATVVPSDENYIVLCQAYKAALEDQIAVCGDPDGSFQLLVDALGDCGEEPSASGDYWPMNVENSWTYNQKIDGVSQPESTMKIGGVEDYLGVSRYYYSNFIGAAQGTDGTGLENINVKYYTHKHNGDYHIAISEMTLEIPQTYKVTQSAYDYIILRDYLDVGGKWSTSFDVVTSYAPIADGVPNLPDVKSNYNIDCEILDKNISVESNGVTFSNVIKLGFKQVTSIEGLPASTATVDYVYYFAKDVGVVKVEGTVYDADDNITSNVLQELKVYTVN
ncbi:hypothetical protein [Aestuariivivens insulae]|uniref:hypothetical protein n=1 Tax=Aestuariivivens insulae TaxID=1621988 RepID=UPI001F5717DC|nr:hypothetical protein [Aestuariivivens insulae]